ncbi:phospholipase A2 homolog EPL_00195-like [Hemicordylus capensis]|uniref:phospholipase A2 homolog EPL_00195-like n=1 Tax=Hemicordylus capensis TaxID=884348 RepID=UPI002304D00F|nr:phospholipase A2 homolog EPL_00195-like [Hemicordylus capensis]
MKHFLAMVMLFTSCTLSAHGAEEDRERMIADLVKVNDSLFRSYGCHCGIKEIGSFEPKDYIDVCCQILNCCYEDLKPTGCYAETRYKYTYDGEDMANKASWCEVKVCTCDRLYSICLLDSHGLFNKDFIPSGERDCMEIDLPGCSLAKK